MNGQTLISPSETKRFATHAVSHWNPYERRIGYFAGSFVFKSLAPFSFRRFHGAPVFNGLAPLFVSRPEPEQRNHRSRVSVKVNAFGSFLFFIMSWSRPYPRAIDAADDNNVQLAEIAGHAKSD